MVPAVDGRGRFCGRGRDSKVYEEELHRTTDRGPGFGAGLGRARPVWGASPCREAGAGVAPEVATGTKLFLIFRQPPRPVVGKRVAFIG